MSTVRDTHYRTFQATAAALSRGQRVKCSAGAATIETAGDDRLAIGVANEDIAASGWGTVRLWGPTCQFIASAATAQGAALYATASGKVDDGDAGTKLIGYVALEAATADGDVIEAALCHYVT